MLRHGRREVRHREKEPRWVACQHLHPLAQTPPPTMQNPSFQSLVIYALPCPLAQYYSCLLSKMFQEILYSGFAPSGTNSVEGGVHMAVRRVFITAGISRTS
jgi:hypothetical protein